MSPRKLSAWWRQLFHEPTDVVASQHDKGLERRIDDEERSAAHDHSGSQGSTGLMGGSAARAIASAPEAPFAEQRTSDAEEGVDATRRESRSGAAKEALEQNEQLKAQVAVLEEREAALRQQVSVLKERHRAAGERAEKLKETVRAHRAQVAKANERHAQIADQLSGRLASSVDQIAKLRASVQEQRQRVLQANERTAHVKSLMHERSLVQKEKLTSAREKLVLKNAYYDAAKRYLGIYRQGLLFDEMAKSDVDFGADAYVCLLPSSVPAGLALSRLKGGRVYCDCVENVEVHKHSIAPNVHPPTLELMNLAAFGSLMAVDGMLTVGNAIARTLTKFGPPVHVAPNFRRFEEPVPTNELRDACGLGPDDRLLFASGNVVVGFEPVVRALAELPDNVHLAAFVKLKPETYKAAVMREITELGLDDRIHFFDFVDYSRLAGLAAEADVGLITSDISNPNGAVGLPNRLFDYLTAGLPVVAPPMPDVVDILTEHGFGKALSQVTADNWADAIAEVLENHQAYKDAAARARGLLTWENGEDDIVDFLGSPRSVTLIGFRDLSRYQRFLRIARTLSSRGVKVKALFLSDDPAPVDIPGAEFYCFSNRYGLGDGPTLVPQGR